MGSKPNSHILICTYVFVLLKEISKTAVLPVLTENLLTESQNNLEKYILLGYETATLELKAPIWVKTILSTFNALMLFLSLVRALSLCLFTDLNEARSTLGLEGEGSSSVAAPTSCLSKVALQFRHRTITHIQIQSSPTVGGVGGKKRLPHPSSYISF